MSSIPFLNFDKFFHRKCHSEPLTTFDTGRTVRTLVYQECGHCLKMTRTPGSSSASEASYTTNGPVPPHFTIFPGLPETDDHEAQPAVITQPKRCLWCSKIATFDEHVRTLAYYRVAILEVERDYKRRADYEDQQGDWNTRDEVINKGLKGVMELQQLSREKLDKLWSDFFFDFDGAEQYFEVLKPGTGSKADLKGKVPAAKKTTQKPKPSVKLLRPVKAAREDMKVKRQILRIYFNRMSNGVLHRCDGIECGCKGELEKIWLVWYNYEPSSKKGMPGRMVEAKRESICCSLQDTPIIIPAGW